MMQLTKQTTVKSILDIDPDAVQIFLQAWYRCFVCEK